MHTVLYTTSSAEPAPRTTPLLSFAASSPNTSTPPAAAITITAHKAIPNNLFILIYLRFPFETFRFNISPNIHLSIVFFTVQHMIIYFFKIHINVINDCNFINTIEIAALKLKLYQSSINTRQPAPAEHPRGVRESLRRINNTIHML